MLWLIGTCASVDAHPVPFSYIDARVEAGKVDVTVVVHTFDISNDLKIQPSERVLERETLDTQSSTIINLVQSRIALTADGEALRNVTWSAPEGVPDRQSIRLQATYMLTRPAGRLDVVTLMFPYDPEHRTFLNVYENGSVAAQAILDKDRTTFEYFTGTRQGIRAVLQKFVPAGVHHILVGPDHLLFLVGLLLLGGTLKQLLLVVTAFTIAHSITLSLAALGVVIPPANAIEPAIALSIVYVGADNLLVSAGGRDTRAWIAFAFGFIHGFGFANVLREMDLPGRALGWTLFAFNIGVEIGQLVFVMLVASLLIWIRSRSEAAARRLVFAGSIFVMLAGAFWFVERVFFPGGLV
ncbi:MAG TPA: HupE/UreJ family protein [Vicinamibacterales bacterium]|nr:HupE/UreJ family protein [Vicinamibacterales bacterium]